MNARESRLLIAFGVIALVGLGFIGFKLMTRWKESIGQREQAMVNTKVEAEELLAMGDFWTARSDWLSQRQPSYRSQKDADNELSDLITDTAKQNNITLGARSQEEPTKMGSSVGAALVIAEAKAPYEKMLRWLQSLQHPEAFVAVTGMTLKPDAEDTAQLYVTDLRVQKWYRNAPTAGAPTEPTAPASAAPVPPAEPAPEAPAASKPEPAPTPTPEPAATDAPAPGANPESPTDSKP
jgi:hypothetical protein